MSAMRNEPRLALVAAPGRVGGLESAVSELAVGLQARGVPIIVVQLLSPDGPPAEAFELAARRGVDVMTVRTGSRAYWSASRRLASVLGEQSVEVVHSHGERADLITRMAVGPRVARVSTVHGFITNTPKSRIAKRLHLRLLAGADAVVAVSAVLANELQQHVRPERVRLMANALAGRALRSREEARSLLGLPVGHEPVVGWVGRFSPEKDPRLFLEALARGRRTDLCGVMVGDGPLLADSRAFAAAQGLADRCVFPGVMSDAGSLFRAFDLFVLSSQTEGTPMTILEAMRAGVPVVATAVGGVPVLLAGDAGWLVPARSPERLAQALEEALGDPAERARRVSAAQSRVESHYALDAWLDAHQALYREVHRRSAP